MYLLWHTWIEIKHSKGLIEKFKKIYRYLFCKCLDCGAKWNTRGEVCKECWDNFNGATIDEIMA